MVYKISPPLNLASRDIACTEWIDNKPRTRTAVSKTCFSFDRARRRRARETKSVYKHHDGLSSDDEENQSEISKYNVEKG